MVLDGAVFYKNRVTWVCFLFRKQEKELLNPNLGWVRGGGGIERKRGEGDFL